MPWLTVNPRPSECVVMFVRCCVWMIQRRVSEIHHSNAGGQFNNAADGLLRTAGGLFNPTQLSLEERMRENNTAVMR